MVETSLDFKLKEELMTGQSIRNPKYGGKTSDDFKIIM